MKVQILDGSPLETGLLKVPGTDSPFVIIEGSEAAAYGVSLASLLELIMKDDKKPDGREVFIAILKQFSDKLNAALKHQQEKHQRK